MTLVNCLKYLLMAYARYLAAGVTLLTPGPNIPTLESKNRQPFGQITTTVTGPASDVLAAFVITVVAIFVRHWDEPAAVRAHQAPPTQTELDGP